MPREIFWMILHLSKIFKTQKEYPLKSVSRSKLLKLHKLKLIKHQNSTDQLLQEVHLFTSYSLTCPRFTHSTNIHFNHLLMLSTELSIKSLKDLVGNKKCMRLTKMVMPSFQKSKREEKTKRKQKWLNNTINKKASNKFQNNKTNKLNKEQKGK